MTIRTVCTAVLALAALPLLASQARAEQITIKMDTGGTSVSYNPYGGAQVTVGGGPFHWTQTSPPNAAYPNTFLTYCIELDQFVTVGNTYTFQVEPNLAAAPTIGNSTKADAITELFDRYYANSLTSTANQAAFQLALWDLVYDGTTKSLSSGRIQGSNAAAQAMLTSLGTPYSNHDLNGYHLVALVSDKYQDQIVVVPNAPVPAPPALGLAVIGLVALAGRGRLLRRA